MEKPSQELEHILLINTCKGAYESQQHKLNLILKYYSSESSVTQLTSDWLC